MLAMTSGSEPRAPCPNACYGARKLRTSRCQGASNLLTGHGVGYDNLEKAGISESHDEYT